MESQAPTASRTGYLRAPTRSTTIGPARTRFHNTPAPGSREALAVDRRLQQVDDVVVDGRHVTGVLSVPDGRRARVSRRFTTSRWPPTAAHPSADILPVAQRVELDARLGEQVLDDRVVALLGRVLQRGPSEPWAPVADGRAVRERARPASRSSAVAFRTAAPSWRFGLGSRGDALELHLGGGGRTAGAGGLASRANS